MCWAAGVVGAVVMALTLPVSGENPATPGWTADERRRDYRRSTTQSMQAVSASTSDGSMAGYIAMRSWLRPSLR